MSTTTTPPTARTDARTGSGRPPARPDHDHPAANAVHRPGPSPRTIRRLGLALAAGAATWAAGLFVAADSLVETGGISTVTSLFFQVGLLALLAVQVRTRATGTGRVARAFLVAEHVLVAGAIVSTLNDAFFPGVHGSLYWQLADAFWPLSMLGMFGIGIRIAIAGRWRGAARFWPLVAESWAPVVIPVAGAAPAVAGYAGGAHLLIGYVALGLILAARPGLVTGGE